MRRVLLTSLAVAVVALSVGCGSDDDNPAATTTTTAAVAPDATTGTTAPDRSADRTRLVIAPVLSSGGCPPGVTAPGATTAEDGADGTDGATTSAPEAAPDAPAAEATAGDATTVPETTVPETTVPETTVTTAPGGPFPTADGVFCYTVGEPAFDGNALTDATLSRTGDDEWQVLARVKPESTEDLNELFNACYRGDPVCPGGEGGTGAVAIVWEGTVMYAPAITVEDLADGPFSLAGGLTERRARDLITLVNR